MIAVIAGDLGKEGVERLVQSTAPEHTVRAERKLYCPYFWLQLRYGAHTFLGKSAVRLSCFVDSRTRIGATTDPFELEALPGGVFGRGYIKSYAELLDIDPKPLLESYGIEERKRQELSQLTQLADARTRRGSAGLDPARFLVAILCAALVGLVAALRRGAGKGLRSGARRGP